MSLSPWLGWLNLIHVIAVLAFVLVHGASGLLALMMRRERDRARLTAMVELSASFLPWGWIALVVVFFGGILSGVAGGWWTSGRLWIWASLIIFVVVAALMTPLASGYMEAVRGALGLRTVRDRRADREPAVAVGDEELARIVSSTRPVWAAGVGLAGIAILTWLMMMKPF